MVLEDYDHAVKREQIYGEIVGYGATCDAYHMTSPDQAQRGVKINAQCNFGCRNPA